MNTAGVLLVLGVWGSILFRVDGQITCGCFSVRKALSTPVYDSKSSTKQEIGQLKQHQCLEILSGGCSDGWCQVSFNGQVAYIQDDSITTAQDCAHPTKAQTLCLSTHCGTGSNIGRGHDDFGYGHYGASRGSRNHDGSDVKCAGGQSIFAPFKGYVFRGSSPYGSGSCQATPINKGFIFISTDAQWPGYAIQIFYAKDYTTKKDYNKGDKIATHVSLDDCPTYAAKTMTDHSHFAMFKFPDDMTKSKKEQILNPGGGYGKYRVDPTSFLYCDFPSSGGSGITTTTTTTTTPDVPTSGAKSWFNCINIKFLKEREGQIQTVGYVPMKDGKALDSSGVTIGSGVDLGSKNEAYFKNIGVSDEIIAKLKPYFGLTQDAALAVADANGIVKALTLKYTQAKSLSDKVILHTINSIAKEYNDDIAAGKKKFEELTDAQRTVILSVRFQYGGKSRTPKFWGFVTAQTWNDVENELRNFGDKYPTRRKLEADLLKNDNGQVSDCSAGSTSGSSGTTSPSSSVQPGKCGDIERIYRSGWNAAASKSSLSMMTTPVKNIFIHHTDTPLCTTQDECKNRIKNIQSYHQNTRNYDDIGYNWLVGGDGRAYEGRGWKYQGAHTYGCNSNSVAISLMGNFETDQPSDTIMNAVRNLIDCAIKEGILVDWNKIELRGHKDSPCAYRPGDQTSCPGQYVYNIIKTWPWYTTDDPVNPPCRAASSDPTRCRDPIVTSGSSTNQDSGSAAGSGCEQHGDLRKLSPTGCSSETAKAHSTAVAGVDGSGELMDKDYTELLTYKDCVYTTAHSLGLHPALIGAMLSRLSRVGKSMGTDSSKHGIMQCNDNLHNRPGVDCTKYDADSCDHIKMMLEHQLLPDVEAVQRKHTSWKPEQVLQGAVAAYDFGVGLVQTLARLDIGSSGNDFSNDIMARAQYLINEKGWSCDDVISPGAPGGGQPPAGKSCKQLADDATDCTFYEDCIDEHLPCRADGYAIGYGKKYCEKFGRHISEFTPAGQAWVNKVRPCLKNALLPVYRIPSMTCEKLKNIAFESHPGCYVGVSPSFCDIVWDNIGALWTVFDTKDFFSSQAVSQVYQTMRSCLFGSSDKKRSVSQADLLKLQEVKTHLKQLVSSTSDVDLDAVNDAECLQYAAEGDCRFLECFIQKFPFDSASLENHIKAFELPFCTKLQQLNSVFQVGMSSWSRAFRKKQMAVVKELFNQNNAVDYVDIFAAFNDARAESIADSGFCSFVLGDEFYLERIINTNFPYIMPLDYSSLPLSGKILRIDNYFYGILEHVQKQFGEAKELCYDRGQSTSPNFYDIIPTVLNGILRIRT